MTKEGAYRVSLADDASPEEGIVTIDGIDCELERTIVQQLELNGIGKFLLTRGGGVRSDVEIAIHYPRKLEESVEKGVYQGLRMTIEGAEKTKPHMSRERIANIALTITTIAAILFGSAKASHCADMLSARPLLAQMQTFPIVRFWDGTTIVNGGDSVNNALRVNIAASSGTLSADVSDRAGRLLGVIYGSQGQQLLQRAVTFDTQVQLRTAGTEYDARQIRALTASDVVDVNDAFLLDATFTTRINTLGQKTMANSTPITIASDQTTFPVTATVASTTLTSVIPGTGATNIGKAEDVGHTTGDTGVFALAVRTDTTATQVTSATTDYSQISVDAFGTIYIRQDSPNRVRCTINSTAVTSTVVTGCAAPGASLSIYITDISFYNTIAGAAANPFTLQFGTGGTCGTGTTIFWQSWNGAALSGVEVHLTTPLRITANNEVCFLQVGAGTRLVNLAGFIAP